MGDDRWERRELKDERGKGGSGANGIGIGYWEVIFYNTKTRSSRA
jgi:hypothetical protein